MTWALQKCGCGGYWFIPTQGRAEHHTGLTDEMARSVLAHRLQAVRP